MDTRKDSAASVGVTTTPESPRPARSSESLGSAVHQIFENQVARTPDAVALIWENDQMTYRELNARANRLAHYLRACGVTREGLTGVCLRRSPETVIAFLAILKAGGAYVPLDPDYPPERLAFMLEDTRAPVIVTDRNCANALPHHGATVVMIDESAEAIRTQDPTNPALGTTTRDLVYVMYTSGSTGRPKGVMIEHRAVARLVRGADYAAFDATQRFLLLAPISFDASTFEIWGPLLNGGSLAIAPPETPSLEQIGNLIERLGVTTLWLTAGLFNLMVDQHPERLRPLRQLLAGGDALSVAHCRKALAAFPGCRLINGYGPTETTTFAVCMTLRPEHLSGATAPIGFPINETQVYLLDRDLNPAAAGESGELCIGGAGVARGYLNQPALTAEKFITPAWLNRARLYRSGDQARYGADGAIEFIGRLDDQIKISGYRVEPNEVACVLREHPRVRDAAVIAEKTGVTARLIAYVAGDPRNPLDRDELRTFLASKLPPFMVPSAFVTLETIPLTNNGKVDRTALPAVAARPAPVAPSPSPSAAGTENLEAKIAAIWRAVLKQDDLDPRQNFFDLGGDSLRLIEVHSHLRKHLGAKISITDLFEYPTINAIAQRIGAGAPAPPISDGIDERARRQRELLARRAKS
jgi:amino acid adenylation domain-containing protein